MVDKDLLRKYRELNNYDYRTLAKKIKCPKKVVELWETGDSIPKEKDILKLCELYNIEVEDLMLHEPKKVNIIKMIIGIILGISSGILLKNNIIMILSPIFNLVFILTLEHIMNLKNENKDSKLTSLLGVELNDIKNKRLKIYLYEANIISSAYSIFNIIMRILNIDLFVIKINLIGIPSVNESIILISTYLLLMFISFIIELGFGEYMIKKYKEV